MAFLLRLSATVDFHTEDGGSAAIAEISTEEDDVFVRIQEWHDDPADNTFVPTLTGKRVTVIITDEES